MSKRENIAGDIITKLDAVTSPIEFKKITREPFEVEEGYWFNNVTSSFMMEGIDEQLTEEDFRGAQGCCIISFNT